jgi:8-oxo-dGTP pyrophosphatase MutT (NUDIX family)
VLFADVISRLDTAFQHDLPGAAAHERLAPRPRRQWPDASSAARIRHAAGLLIVFPIEEQAHIVLTVRGDSLGRHGGQVSLPGGVVEPGETVEHAALREAYEEVALPLEDVRVLGALTPLDIPVSGFRLHPIVAALDAQPSLTPSDGEVARILDVSIDELLDPSRFVSSERLRDGLPIVAPAFNVGGEEIWGATAMVLAEFLALLTDRQDA